MPQIASRTRCGAGGRKPYLCECGATDPQLFAARSRGMCRECFNRRQQGRDLLRRHPELARLLRGFATDLLLHLRKARRKVQDFDPVLAIALGVAIVRVENFAEARVGSLG